MGVGYHKFFYWKNFLTLLLLGGWVRVFGVKPLNRVDIQNFFFHCLRHFFFEQWTRTLHELFYSTFAAGHAHIEHIGLQVLAGQAGPRLRIRAENERVLLAVRQQQVANGRETRAYQFALLQEAARLEPRPNGLHLLNWRASKH